MKSDKEELFLAQTGILINNRGLLRQALTHRSYNFSRQMNNERLEFLGDSVVGLVVTQYLYQETGDTEGNMAKIKSIAVGREIMAAVADSISLMDYVYLGKSEESVEPVKQGNIKANVLEAVIGALYLDQGLEQARKTIISLWKPLLEKIFNGEYADYKSRLQEFLQKQNRDVPEYRVMEEKGPDHDKMFLVACLVDGNIVSRGSGKNKKKAEAQAARKAYVKLHEQEGEL